jgi:hypothetical protein
MSPRRGLAAAPGRVEVNLTPEAVARIAAQVAQQLQSNQASGKQDMLSAGELALKLKVERPWVYRNRHLLGGIRLGNGPKAPWRFDFDTAVAALRDLQSGSASEGPR